MWKQIITFGSACSLFVVVGCTESHQYAQAVCVIADSSGTYTDELKTVAQTMSRAVLPNLLPGDSLFLVRIDSDSYDQKNMEGAVTLDQRPTQATQQKAAFARILHRFAERQRGSRYTDITGALMLCGEYLTETKAGDQVIVLFSDLQEELRKGSTRALKEQELQGMRIAAINVKHLHHDQRNPALYRARLEQWADTVQKSGATQWMVAREPNRLLAFLSERP